MRVFLVCMCVYLRFMACVATFVFFFALLGRRASFLADLLVVESCACRGVCRCVCEGLCHVVGLCLFSFFVRSASRGKVFCVESVSMKQARVRERAVLHGLFCFSYVGERYCEHLPGFRRFLLVVCLLEVFEFFHGDFSYVFDSGPCSDLRVACQP